MFIEIVKPVADRSLVQKAIADAEAECTAKLQVIAAHRGRIAECEALVERLAMVGFVRDSFIVPIVAANAKALVAHVNVFYESISTVRTAIRCAGLAIAREDYDETFGEMTFALAGLDCTVIASRCAGEWAKVAA